MQSSFNALKSWTRLRISILVQYLQHAQAWLRDKLNPPSYWDKRARVGVMTCTLNEATCIGFTVGSLLDHVDLYVVIDTGSTDNTTQLLRALYPEALTEGKLILVELGPLPDFDISIARNKALEILQEHNIDLAIKVDGDDVFYDEGAAYLVNRVRKWSPEFASFYCGNYELYQWKAEERDAWFEALESQTGLFWAMGFRPLHPRVYPVKGSVARGRWTDEAQGQSPENLYSQQAGPLRRGTLKVCAAHYGWAKPVNEKIRKVEIWNPGKDLDPRVKTMHERFDSRWPLSQFEKHPEIVARKLPVVRAFFARLENVDSIPTIE